MKPQNWSGSLGPTSSKDRVRIPMQVSANGLAFKLAVVPSGTAWSSFRLWDIEVEFYPRETSRV